MTPKLPQKQMSVKDVADALGVKPSTISRYHANKSMPPADGRVGSVPWWWRSTITRWYSSRPGKGWRKQKAGNS